MIQLAELSSGLFEGKEIVSRDEDEIIGLIEFYRETIGKGYIVFRTSTHERYYRHLHTLKIQLYLRKPRNDKNILQVIKLV